MSQENKDYSKFISDLEKRNDIRGLIDLIRSSNNKNIWLQILDAIERMDIQSEAILDLRDLLTDNNENIRKQVKFLLYRFVTYSVKNFKSSTCIKKKKNYAKILGSFGYAEAIKWLISFAYSTELEDVEYSLNTLENIMENKCENLDTDTLQILSHICVFRQNSEKNIMDNNYRKKTISMKIEPISSKKINDLAKKELDRRSISIILHSKCNQISENTCNILHNCAEKPEIDDQLEEKKAILLNKLKKIPANEVEVYM